MTARALELCSLAPGARVLDVGCGNGATVSCLRSSYGLDAWGVDRSEASLRECRDRNPALPVLQGSAESLPLKGASFDAVFCECVLSLLAEPEAALREFRRVLAGHGRLILTDLYARREGELGEGPGLLRSCCLGGAVSRTCAAGRVEASGFTLSVWEDHSELLKEFSVRAVFVYGSLEAFWRELCPDRNPARMAAQARRVRAGYYLLIATKGIS